MANFRGDTTKDVDLYVKAYDNSVFKNENGEATTQYLDAGIHPDSPRAEGQRLLSLTSKKDEKSPSGYNNTAAYSALDSGDTKSQFSRIKEAAGDNHSPLKTKDGKTVGTVYGIKANLTPARDGSGMAIRTDQEMSPSEFPVQPLTKDGEVSKNGRGRELQERIVDVHRATKAASKQNEGKPAAAEQTEQAQENEKAAEPQLD